MLYKETLTMEIISLKFANIKTINYFYRNQFTIYERFDKMYRHQDGKRKISTS